MRPLICLLAFGVLSAQPADLALSTVGAGKTYALVVSARGALTTPVDVSLRAAGKVIVSKTLHEGDLDLTTAFRAATGPVTLRVSDRSKTHYQVFPLPPGSPVEFEPNSTPEEANPYRLGETLFASGDEAPYFPKPGERGKPYETSPDWFRFDFDGKQPTLVYFWIDLAERDHIPVDVEVFRWENGKAIPYHDGEDPVALPHEVQAQAGNKFTARVLKNSGTYLIRVMANHPEYKLRTRTYPVPPYSDPAQAVRTAVDFALGAGDSWHANTPRKGGVWDRVASLHQETSLCVACHATHFPQRAALYAARNGYPVHMRQQLQFLTERFYNNPRPLYGFEQDGAVWARMISAAANVLGRMSHLLDLYEKEIALESRPAYHKGVGEYLKIYYKDRTKLPQDETNGNTPLVSTYEVAWYAWENNHDPAIVALLEQDEIKNMVDLCYQTLALAAIDKAKYKDKLARNAERILSLQRPSGQWAMRFGPKEQEVEFQTGHALWALQAAGVARDHPQVKKGIDYLLSRQQEFGAWMDPLQSYENFRTPFRETQMAVLALSSYYPLTGRTKGWNVVPEGTQELNRLDAVWSGAAPSATPADPITRQAYAEALGRLAQPASLPALIALLGDDSKLVQRTAAWAVRQTYSRHPETDSKPLLQALRSPEPRVQWGASRVFAQHFAGLAKRQEFVAALMELSRNPSPAIASQATKGLWQSWFWSADPATKDAVEDVLLARLGQPLHPWVEENLRHAIYNIADENIRYLYNNWVPGLARPEDQERVIRGRLAVEDRLASKFSQVLETGSSQEQKLLLSALVEFPLRRADAYEPKANLQQAAPPVYNRIGNDIEQIVWFGESAGRFGKALLPLVESKDPELRRLATEATLMLRDPKFGGVEKIAGDTKPLRDYLQTVLSSRQDDFPEVWRVFRPPVPMSSSAPRVPRTSAVPRPDEAYFRGYVQPILEKRGKDGAACVHCHATHTLFDGTWGKALNVVDLENPENSLILRKPISTAESEGVVGAAQLSHGGGVRWEKGSPEYNTILEWIRGAKP